MPRNRELCHFIVLACQTGSSHLRVTKLHPAAREGNALGLVFVVRASDIRDIDWRLAVTKNVEGVLRQKQEANLGRDLYSDP